MLHRRVGLKPTETNQWRKCERKHPKGEPEPLGWAAEMVTDVAEEEECTAHQHHPLPVGIAVECRCAKQNCGHDPAVIIITIGHVRRQKPSMARNHQDRLERGARMDKPRWHCAEYENAEPPAPVVVAKAEQRRNAEWSEEAGEDRCSAGVPDRTVESEEKNAECMQIDAQAQIPHTGVLKVGREPNTFAVAKAVGYQIAGQHPMDRFIAKEVDRKRRQVGKPSVEVQGKAGKEQEQLAAGDMAEPT